MDQVRRLCQHLLEVAARRRNPVCRIRMMRFWRQRRRRRLLHRYAIDDVLWQSVVRDSPWFDRLGPEDLTQLRELTTLFLAEKRFFGAHGVEVDDYMRVSVASRACLLVLRLGLDYYGGWRTVILYPGGFVAEREVEDEIGVVHTGREALDGESMHGGAVVLNWEEARPARAPIGQDDRPTDVVLHEFSHKLDERNGEANGLPPLHRDMSVAEWSRVFNDAYETFHDWLDADVDELPFDDYAATHPAEFFSVATETFFLQPRQLLELLPAVYRELARFYRQDPAGALSSAPLGAAPARPGS
jgi:hypothetical protein